MTAYVVRRLLFTIPVLLGVALLVFLLFHSVGEDPARVALGQHASPAAVAQLRQQWGLDRPLPLQFAEFLRQVVSFDYGRSFTSHERLSDLIASGWQVSLALTLPPFAIGMLLNLALGLLLAQRSGGLLDRAAGAVFALMMSTSYLVYIIALQYFLAYRLGWFPVGGYRPGADAVHDLALPWLVLVLVGLGPDARVYRSIFLEELGADYLRTARAKGASELRALCGHVLKNALVPVLTRGLAGLPYLLLGAFLLERYFSLPGLGDLLISAIANGDFPILKGLTMTLALAYSAVILLVDLLYAWVDPRITLR